MKRVLHIGSSAKSGGGISSLLRSFSNLEVWKRYEMSWLGTQTQGRKIERLIYALRAAVIAPFVIIKYSIVHFHLVPGTGLITHIPQLLFAKLYRKKVALEIHVGNQLNDNVNNELFKWWLRRADVIILLANRWKEAFNECFPDISTPVEVLYNACDILPEVPEEEKGGSIIMAAYLNDNKAPDLLLKAWIRLKDKYPEWNVTIMGNGEVERYKKMAESLALPDVKFPGYLTGDVKDREWRKASIYCMCSYQEGFPMVVLEAWNYGVCVVTTPVGGLTDVIEDGKNCLVFPFGDVDALANQLERLITDEELRKELRSNGRALVNEKFSLQCVDKQLDSIYSRLIG